MGGNRHKLVRSVVALAAAAACFTSVAPQASADRAFNVARFSQNDVGNIDLIGNTVLSCSTTLSANCEAARNGTGNSTVNNDYQMRYVDIDSDTTTFNSSSATLDLPDGAEVLFAGLYWGGQTTAGGGGAAAGAAAAPTPAANNVVKLDDPGTGGYVDITASVVDNGTGGQASRYQAYANVTSLVSAAGDGTYTLANLQTSNGTDTFGGWSIVIAYRDTSQPARNLTIIDGLQSVAATAAPISIPVSGFRTPPSGTVQTTAGFITYEGDLGYTGDGVQVNGTQLSDALNPGNPTPNSFNSTIGKRGTRFSAKSPDYVNQLGYDADLFSADGLLGNNATSATIRVQTNGDAYLPGVITFATELYAPEIRPVKTALDVNGGRLERGDIVEYTVRLTNTGDDRAINVVMRDQIPAGTTYVPGTLQQNTLSTGASCAAGYTARTDSVNTDTGEFDTANNRVVFRMGSGASGTAGGSLSPNQTECAKFRVRVNNNVLPRFTIDNVASADFNGESLGTAFTAIASNDTTDEVVAPDLTISKSHTGGAFVGGNSYNFSLGVTNAGNLSTNGAVTVTDSFPAASFASVNSVSGTGWDCSASSGLNVSCTRNDVLANGASYPPIQVNATVVGAPPATVVNTATVVGGGDTNLANNSGTDSSGATAQADLSIVKTAPDTTVFAGDETTFTLEVENLGPSPASDVQVSDVLSPNFTAVSVTSSQGTCTTLVACDLNALARNGTATIEIVARVNASADGTTPRNTASVSDAGGSNDPVSSNNSSSVDITVPPTADLSVTKDFSPKPNPEAGEQVTWTIAVTNNGPATATGVTAVDTIPAEVAVSPTPAATIQGGSCTFQAGPPRRIICTVPSLASGASATMTVTGTLRPNAGSATVTNSVSVSGNQADHNLSNNSADSSFLAVPSADLDLVKSGPNTPVQVGSEFNFTLTARNLGPSDAYGAEVVDTLPAGLEYVSSSNAGCSAAGQIVTCPLGTADPAQGNERVFGPASSSTFTIRVRVLAAAASGSSVTNSALVRQRPNDPANYPEAPDPVPTNNSAEATTQVTQRADLAIIKTATPNPVGAGANVTYTLSVTNNGPSRAVDVEVTDNLPASLTLVSADPEQGSCTQTDPVDCDLGDIPSGETVEVEIEATVGVNQAGNTISNTGSVSSDTPDPTPGNDSATEEVDVAPEADLEITKTASPDPVRAGQDVTYTLTVTNNGPNTANNVIVDDNLPASLTLVSATPDLGTCTQTDPVECDLGTMANGDSIQIEIVATVGANQQGATISNTATVDADELDSTPGNDSDTAQVDVAAEADLAISKVADPNPAAAGENVTYTLTVTNNGPNDATNVEVTDDLPASLTLVSADPEQGSCTQSDPVDCDLNTIASGDSVEIEIETTVGANQTGNTISNTASVRGDQIDPEPSNDSATEELDVTPVADLEISKTADPNPVRAGESTTFTLSVTNNGPNQATGVEVTDDLPAGLAFVSATPDQGSCAQADPVVCDLGTIANGVTVDVEVAVTVASDQTGNTISNTASVVGDQFDPSLGNNDDTEDLEVPAESDLVITKDVDPDPVRAGANLTYTLTVTNNGPNDATNVEVTDDLPASLTLVSADPEQGSCTQSDPVDCDLNSIASGDSVEIEIVATVGNAQAGNTISNAASVEADEIDPDPDNNSDTVDVDVSPEADIQLRKAASPDPVRAGAELTYTLTVTNNGPNDATNVEVTDDLPASLTLESATPDQGTCTQTDPVECDLGTIANGDSVEIEIVATVGATQQGSTISNTAEADADQIDLTPGNNDDSVDVDVSPEADLAITKLADVNPISAGENVIYTLRVTNDGPNQATNVEVTDDLPAGLTFVSATPDQGTCTQNDPVECDLGTIASGDFVEIEIEATVGTNQTGNTISNTASVSGDQIDPEPSNDSATEELDVTPVADLEISKTADPNPVRAGEPTTFTLSVTNNGPNQATGVEVTDDLPAGLTLVSATPEQGSCAQADPVVCDLGTLANGDTVDIEIEVTVGASLQGASLTNVAIVGSDTFDPDAMNNVDSELLEVTAEADLEIRKVADPNPTAAGEDVTYTITVTNNGPNAATDVEMTDDLPAGLTYRSANPEQGSCAENAGTVECDLDTIGSGDSVLIQILVTVGANQTGNTITNVASVESPVLDPDTDNNEASVDLDVTPETDLEITKTADPDPVASGSDVTYTLTVTNNGPNDATGVSVTDDLPASLTLVSATPDQGTCAQADPVECDLGTIAGGDSVEIEIIATVGEDESGNSISNTAAVEGDQFDPTPGNNSDEATIDVSPEANLAITKVADENPAAAGEDVTYTLTVTNNGPNQATGVEVTDDLPAGLTLVSATPEQGNCTQSDPVECDLNAIASGESVEIEIVVTVDADQTGNTISNMATVGSDTFDPDDSDNEVTEDVDIRPEADLQINKTVAPLGGVRVGGLLTYTITVTNNGPNTAEDVVVTDMFASPVKFVSATASQGQCRRRKPIVCSLGSIADDATATIEIVVRPRQKGRLVNDATVEASTADLIDSNDEDEATVNTERARIDVQKKADRRKIDVGDLVTYSITVRSLSDVMIENVKVCDRLPKQLELVSAPLATVRGSKICWRINLVPRAKRSFLIVARALPISYERRIPNIASAVGPNVDKDSGEAVVTIKGDPTGQTENPTGPQPCRAIGGIGTLRC